MKNEFLVDNTKFSSEIKITESFGINSNPENYIARFCEFSNTFTEKDVVLVDKNVKELYNIQHTKLISVEAIEQNKSIEKVLEICETLSQYKFDKGNTLVVIGGGIIQDIGAFTAKVYKRGINWIFYPTTLLSQCDSCIGGKTALNFKNYKNQLALFSAPKEVRIDTKFLDTLSPEDIISGYGEIVKLFLIGGQYYVDNLPIFDFKQAIFHALSIKKAVIDHDEFEINERKSLNYGHSFGHVIEPLTNYTVPHGEAVLLGIEIINQLFSKNEKITEIVSKYTNLDKIKHLSSIKIFEMLSSDKKVKNNIISFVVVPQIGTTEFIEIPLNLDLQNRLDEIFTN